jgi:hypothetical protein
MTTQITKAKSQPQLPAVMLEELNREALAIKERIGSPSGDRISVNARAKTFRLPGMDQEAPEISAIIVDWVSLNEYYEGTYDPKAVKPPVCVALGAIEKELAPVPQSPSPQHTACATCKWNQWGSEGRGKKCKNQRLLAVLSPTDQEHGPMLMLKVSPTGVQYFDKYVSMISQSGIHVPHPMAIVTQLSFDPKSDYASMRFAVGEPNAHVEIAFSRRKEARERLLTPPSFPVKVAE